MLCDQPGCDLPARHITQVTGANTPTKAWFGCDPHQATTMDLTDQLHAAMLRQHAEEGPWDPPDPATRQEPPDFTIPAAGFGMEEF